MLTTVEMFRISKMLDFINNTNWDETTPEDIWFVDSSGNRVARIGWDPEAQEYAMLEVPVT